MILTELIIKAHVTVHAAELAIKTNSQGSAYDELDKLRILLTGELVTMDRPEGTNVK